MGVSLAVHLSEHGLSVMDEPAPRRVSAVLVWAWLVVTLAALAVPLVLSLGPHTSHALCSAFGSIYTESCIARSEAKR
jgi:hypothetical protein